VFFTDRSSTSYKNHRPTLTKKANELWTLAELEPGDIIVANKGTSHVLAVGEVVEPGYEFNSERGEYKHTVRVKWNTDYARDIPSQNRWALVTVAPVAAALYQQIVTGKTEGSSPPSVPVEMVFTEIADALERKGQAILYGPPGTGKTYTARRFAVWWLRRHAGERDPAAPLAAHQEFTQAELDLSTVQVDRKVWWVVANPKEWNWDRLFSQGKVAYRYGRLRRNYPRVQKGDLVIGYQSTPDKRIMALAEVSRGLHSNQAGEQGIELKPVARIKNGLTFDELAADKTIADSEPMRFRNQGTLFGLNDDEAEHLLSELVERNPELRDHIEDKSAVGPLTRLTFHASYSYEDFIEGFRPVDTGGGALSLRLEDGVFKRICREAQANPKRRYVVLIDEINRANVAKVLGELITLLEMDKRGLIITLPQSKESFTIPPNVYVLATMNTADRSIKLLDAALRRRFAFIEMMPDTSLLEGARIGNLALDDFLDELNRRVSKQEGREKQIGHSFLFEDGQPVADAPEFARRFKQEVLPLLQEYCYDDYAALAAYIGKGIVDAEGQALRQNVLSDPDALVAALEIEFAQPGQESS
jgi:5-methylcytosine-specific restriction protein B